MKTINTAPNSPFKGYLPNVNPFGISPRYNPSTMEGLYKKATEEKVTSTIKPIEEDEANIEAEKNEVLLTFKNTGLALHKIQGKPHSKGGTLLNVPDGSFIFSKDKSMALTENEIETFNLGKFLKGGNVKNSPAKVLERNVNFKHNNKMIDLLENSKNFAEKNTAKLMLDKYQKSISNIAALQEIRKPNSEIPQFAQLIPKNPIIENEKNQQKQYSKGGFIQQRSIPKAQQGLSFRTVNGIRIPILDDPNDVPDMMKSMNQNLSNLYQEQIVEQSIPQYQPIASNSQYNLSDNLSWIKPYDWTSKSLSMIGNALQSPRALYPSLALQTPYQVTNQQIDAQPGLDSINSNAFASRKANQMYAPYQLQNNQLIDSQANKMATDYAARIAQGNQQSATNSANFNAQINNQVLNNNNQARAQFMDKVNELKQNITDTRNAIGATNLNLLGESINENRNYNTTIDFLKRYQPWNVQSKIGEKDVSKMIQDYNRILRENPAMDDQMKWILLKSLSTPYKQQTPNMSIMQSLLQR